MERRDALREPRTLPISWTMDGGANPKRFETLAGASPQAYRDAMACVAGQVHIVTTAGPAGVSGFTAIAVASISDDPPTLLVCLNAKSANGGLIEANGRFAVSALPEGAAELAETFAGRTGLSGEARFGLGAWLAGPTGAPLLSGATANFDCELMEMRRVATHHILMGRVVAARASGASGALVYFGRDYRIVRR